MTRWIHLLFIFVTGLYFRFLTLTGYTIPFEKHAALRLYNDWPFCAFFFGDAWDYMYQAMFMSRGGSYGLPFRPPLATWLTTAGCRIAGCEFPAIHWLFIGLGAVIPVLVVLLARRWLPAAPAFTAGWITALSFNMLILSGTICQEIPALVLLLSALILWTRSGPWSALTSGILFCLALYGRPELALFLVLLLALSLLKHPRPVSRILLSLAGITLTLCPWTIRNAAVISTAFPNTPLYKKIVPISFNGPVNFHIGNGPAASGGYRDFAADPADWRSGVTIDLNDPQHRARVFGGYRLGWNRILENPGMAARVMVRKLRYWLRGFRAGIFHLNVPVGRRGYLHRGDIWVPQIGYMTYVWVCVVLIGWILLRRIAPESAVIVLLLTLTSLVNALVFFGMARSSAMLIPFHAIPAAVFLSAAGRFLARRWGHARRLGIAAAGCLLTGMAIHGAILIHDPHILSSSKQIMDGIQSGISEGTFTRAEALRHYESALEAMAAAESLIIFEEEFSRDLTNFATLLNGDDPPRVRQLLDRAIDLDYSNASAWKLRGVMNLNTPGHTRAAVRDLDRYMAMVPRDPDNTTFREAILYIGMKDELAPGTRETPNDHP